MIIHSHVSLLSYCLFPVFRRPAGRLLVFIRLAKKFFQVFLLYTLLKKPKLNFWPNQNFGQIIVYLPCLGIQWVLNNYFLNKRSQILENGLKSGFQRSGSKKKVKVQEYED